MSEPTNSPRLLVLGGVVLVAAVGIASWLTSHKSNAPPPASPSPPTPPSHQLPQQGSPLESHILRLLAILSDSDSGDRACSRALDAAQAIAATHEGRSLLSKHSVLPLLVDLLYRSVPTPLSSSLPPNSRRRNRSLSTTSSSSSSSAAAAAASSSSGSLSSSSSDCLLPASELFTPDLIAVVTKSVTIISNLSLDLQNQQQLRKIEAFPLLNRFLEDDMPSEIQERALQAFLNLSVFEGMHEDALRDIGLLQKLPHLLLSDKSSLEVRVLSLKVLRNLVVTNEENRRALVESDMIGRSLSVLCESETLSQRALELIISLDPKEEDRLPSLRFVDLLKLLDVLRSSISESLADTSIKALLIIIERLDEELAHHLLRHHQ